MALTFISTRNRQGRPKKEENACSKQLSDKRMQIGAATDSQQLTGLFLLWSRKQITQQQFIAGCYYEKVLYRLNRSMGSVAGKAASSIANVHAVHAKEMNNRVDNMRLNENMLHPLAEIDQRLGYVHAEALSVVRKVLQSNCLESAAAVKNLKYQELSLFKHCLSVISQYIDEYAIDVQVYEKLA